MATKETTVSPTGTVLRPTRLAHVVLKTPNFTSMVAWYKAILGAHASYENPGMSSLTYDDEHHRIAIGNFPESPSPENPMLATGLHHIAFGCSSLQDLVTSHKQRRARGIAPFWCVNHGTTTSMYYQDTDGNMVKMQVDAFPTIEETNAYFAGPDYHENPIGVDLDPEELVRRIESGEDEKMILKRANIGPRGVDSVPTPPKPEVRQSYEPLEDLA